MVRDLPWKNKKEMIKEQSTEPREYGGNKMNGRERKEGAKRQREMKSSFIHTVSSNNQCYIQYLRGQLLSSKNKSAYINHCACIMNA